MTASEIADELPVSRQAVNYRLDTVEGKSEGMSGVALSAYERW